MILPPRPEIVPRTVDVEDVAGPVSGAWNQSGWIGPLPGRDARDRPAASAIGPARTRNQALEVRGQPGIPAIRIVEALPEVRPLATESQKRTPRRHWAGCRPTPRRSQDVARSSQDLPRPPAGPNVLGAVAGRSRGERRSPSRSAPARRAASNGCHALLERGRRAPTKPDVVAQRGRDDRRTRAAGPAERAALDGGPRRPKEALALTGGKAPRPRRSATD